MQYNTIPADDKVKHQQVTKRGKTKQRNDNTNDDKKQNYKNKKMPDSVVIKKDSILYQSVELVISPPVKFNYLNLTHSNDRSYRDPKAEVECSKNTRKCRDA
ncbi:46183_t:CDS:2 [Gigaspora margarita]|uniref:46183_t:CDS:1 n=1 Tax=Gigaspora margarita TaxID=4874 RepID=A0ABN7UKZ0_GIGMA|nr:46183_t:CDS:2 [Gigaspora margarita]